VDLHAEVPPELNVAEAHERISALEAAVRAELPYVVDVNTHIEPRAVPVGGAEVTAEVRAELKAQILAITEGVPGLRGCHKVRIRPAADGYDVVVHCLADPSMSITEAHRLADLAEQRLRADIPHIGQVIVHVEPET
jgi:divalent metal cation (Fe/Co/Zn/Cd) transporter